MNEAEHLSQILRFLRCCLARLLEDCRRSTGLASAMDRPCFPHQLLRRNFHCGRDQFHCLQVNVTDRPVRALLDREWVHRLHLRILSPWSSHGCLVSRVRQQPPVLLHALDTLDCRKTKYRNGSSVGNLEILFTDARTSST
jgi:hypothetical protein